MKESDKGEINKFLDQARLGLVDRVYLKNLFTILREKKGTNDYIKELAHFVSHPGERDRGKTLECINRYLINFINLSSSQNGGSLLTYKLFITQSELIRYLKASLLHLKFSENEISVLDNCSHNIMALVIEILHETDLIFEQKDNVTLKRFFLRCLLEKTVDNNEYTLFAVVLPIPNSEKTEFGGRYAMTFGKGLAIKIPIMKTSSGNIDENEFAGISFEPNGADKYL